MILKEAKTEKQPVAILALELLIRKLKQGDFKPGQPIRESVLAEEFGLSRSAVREALNQIVGWDIFEYIPYCGYRLRKFTWQDFLAWREMREAIEPIAARRLAQIRPPEVLKELTRCLDEFENEMKGEARREVLIRLDLNFHLAVVENCGNRHFNHMQTVSFFIALFFCDKLTSSDLVMRIRNTTNQFLPPGFTREEYFKLNMKLTMEKHREMLNNIVLGKDADAERSFREHAVDSRKNIENIINYLKSNEIQAMMEYL